MRICECNYLYKEDDEKIEVCYPSELLEEILRDKVPNCVLKKKRKTLLLFTRIQQLIGKISKQD